MWYVLCNLWAIFLGAALVPLAYIAYLLLPSVGKEIDVPSIDSVMVGCPASPILYLTPTCVRALGRCARPKRLRSMRPECIGRLLDRFSFPSWEERPSPAMYSTWSEQARLLCSGRKDLLAEYQAKLKATHGDPGAERARECGTGQNVGGDNAGSVGNQTLRYAVALATLLVLLAILTSLIARNLDACRCTPIILEGQTVYVPVPNGIKTANLSADLIFDFNMWEPRSPVHRDKLQADLRSLLREFDGIRVRAVVAHTDPIGSTVDNRLLGQRRAASIRQLLAEIVQNPERPGKQFAADPLPPDQATDGPSGDDTDAAFWRACFDQYYLRVPVAYRPLVDLARKKNSDNRVPCSQAGTGDTYPACARPAVPGPGIRPSRGYAQRAEALRELTACIAPMRHVLIQFSYDSVLPSADAQAPNLVKGAAQ